LSGFLLVGAPYFIMGFITINRKLFSHFLWTERRVWSRFEAWIDLIQLASYTDDNEKMINGVLVRWGRGEYPVSYSFLSQRWNWSQQRTRGFIKCLEDVYQINRRITSVATIITLCNYEQYNGQQQADNSETTSGQQADNKRMAGSKTSKENNNTNWRSDFNIYLGECKLAYESFMEDPVLLKTQQRLNPGINIKLSIEKGFVNFWGTEAGWKFKKGKKSKNIDWKSTITNSITMNKVYYTKEEMAKL
jgi:hypothetical protein